MNEYTQKQLRTLDERIAAKNREKEQIMKMMRAESDASLNSMATYMIPAIIVAILLLIFMFCSTSHAEEVNVDRLVDAIYKAEGGDKAQYPYGIRSVKCETKAECRQICINTIKNNIKRWNKYGHKTHKNFLAFLASRYAPVNCDNDPKKLNQNWLRNVSYFLRGA